MNSINFKIHHPLDRLNNIPHQSLIGLFNKYNSIESIDIDIMYWFRWYRNPLRGYACEQ